MIKKKEDFVSPFVRGITWKPKETDKSTTRGYYEMGEKMIARVEPPTGKIEPKYASFTFPKIGSHGMCNNNYWASFMEDTSTECTQSVDLTSQCTGRLNPQNYQSYLKVFPGSDFTDDKRMIDVKLSAIYEFDGNSYDKVSRSEAPQSRLT